MSLVPSIVIRQAYVRIGAYSGTAAEIDTAYSGGVAGLNTESFPLQSMWDLLTATESEMANAVASNANNTLRSLLHGIVTVASGGVVSGSSDLGVPIIGVWGQVRDEDSGIELTPNLHEDEIRALNSSSSIFISNYFSYALRPPRIYATVDAVTIDVCTYDYTTRQDAIENDQALTFQTCEAAYFDGLMSRLKNEDERYTALSNQFAPSYQAWLEQQRIWPRDVVKEAAA